MGEKTDKTYYGPFKLYPLKYPFAQEYFDIALANTWFPQEVPLGEDLIDWESKLTKADKQCLQHFLSFFGTAEALVANNIGLAKYGMFSEAEIRMYLGRHEFEELLHAQTFNYIIDSLNLDRNELYTVEKVKEIFEKESFITGYTRILRETKFKTEHDKIRALFKDLWAFYGILEGTFFFSGFLIGLAFENRQLLKGIATLLRYILRDESVHLAFGFDLMKAIAAEHPKIMDNKFKHELSSMMEKGVQLEIKYAMKALPSAVIGLTHEQYIMHVKYIADRRLEAIGLKKRYNVESPLKWATTITDLPELINFFEAKTFDYQFKIK